jgi:2-polyprenyl-3-methyl-5-hydroxy-6-metoxy-1,4-benzoquinol methylase
MEGGVRLKRIASDVDFETLPRCPACLSPDISFFRKKTFDVFKLDKSQIKITDSQYGKIWDLSRCSACGHIFANPCPSPELIFLLYSQIEDPLYEEEASGRAKNFRRIISHLETFLPDKGRLFDVGAATGILLHLARGRGWEVDGIEASTWAVRLASEKYQIRLHQDFFEEVRLENNFFSAVTLVDFIEHTPLPFAALLKAYEILKPAGIVCLVTPDIHSLAARLAGKNWWHFRPAHLAYFSPQSLAALFRRAGFSVIQVRRYSWTFSVHYLLSRKKIFHVLLQKPSFASFLKKIPIKLALGDSFEVYARKEVHG